MKKALFSRPMTWTATAALMVLAVAYLGGRAPADPSGERLRMVWPRLDQLADDDRVLLARLSAQCGLQQQERNVAVILGCLQSAAYELDRQEDSTARSAALSRLIRAAAHDLPPPSGQQPGITYSARAAPVRA